jgi:enoyl-CoA hydratase/carnithine racemase
MNTTPLLNIADGIATITLNRPAHRNRLHNEDLLQLMTYFQELNTNAAVKVVVLSANVLAEKPVFSAGYHLGEDEKASKDATFEIVTDTLENLRPITICALNGSVYGGATDFALACDFAIGVQGMEMRMPAAALGLHYYPGGIMRYVSRLGLATTKRAFLTAGTFNDTELLAIGYVMQLASSAEHAPAVQQLAKKILKLAPLAMQTLKCSLNEVARGDYSPERLRARQHLTQISQDFAEGKLAFAQRRAANFRGL